MSASTRSTSNVGRVASSSLDAVDEGSDGDGVPFSLGGSLVQETRSAAVATTIPTRSTRMLTQRTAAADRSLPP
jgi:hypothetical protein